MLNTKSLLTGHHAPRPNAGTPRLATTTQRFPTSHPLHHHHAARAGSPASSNCNPCSATTRRASSSSSSRSRSRSRACSSLAAASDPPPASALSYDPAPADLFRIPEPAQPQEQQLEEGEAEEEPEPAPEALLQEDDTPQPADEDGREKAYLVGVALKRDGPAGRSGEGSSYGVAESLEELGRLADTAGLRVVGSTYQVLELPNNRTYIGTGKITQIARAVRAMNVDTVIFDDELSPGQMRNLEKAFNNSEEMADARPLRLGDRTALILDIFSQRAQTREGKLQVELAQTEYQLPRLTRMWSHLDRVGGGGQTKGTGEKQIETDKRLLRDRASALRTELESVRLHRRNYRERRSILPVPVLALVGYTNAGKSTLLNTLTQADVLAEDKLFATLDPTTRKVRLRGNKELLVSDTVGFIQKLPTELVAAFRATLEEIKDASLLLHLVDISHPHAQAQSDAVCKVLSDLNVSTIPLITAWNKVDQCPNPAEVRAVAARRPDTTICISGKTGEGLDELMAVISAQLSSSMEELEVKLPYMCGDLLDLLHSTGEVLSAEYLEEGILIKARAPASVAGRLQPYSLKPELEKPQRPRDRDVWKQEQEDMRQAVQ